MGTKITKGNAESAIRDDKAHIDYLKRDVLDDQKGGGKYKDINQTADEKHISELAGDIRHDHSFLSKHWTHSSPLNNLGVANLTADSHGKDLDTQKKVQDAELSAKELEGLSKAEGLPEDGDPLPSIDEVVGGEVDGVPYGAADVDGSIAVDIGYPDTQNLA